MYIWRFCFVLYLFLEGGYTSFSIRGSRVLCGLYIYFHRKLDFVYCWYWLCAPIRYTNCLGAALMPLVTASKRLESVSIAWLRLSLPYLAAGIIIAYKGVTR